MKKISTKEMRSLSDMPKLVLLLEVLGIGLLVLAYLSITDSIILSPLLMTTEAHIAMILLGIGCLIPAAIHIIWRAVYNLSFLGIDHKKVDKNHQTGSDDEKTK
ncbi:YbjC family protein [Xenorhabdus bovienii]|uniref:YbjC family protein n=1 Tax=Xenorhabdus bovienii TaxID=40576 RepID=A0AAJ1MY17_XENBV|nr:YbjC family protein [Xenorhabdus bovienii]MDE1477503.1 YbjC family protein [Xenorhabdus bovienii]MDE1487165.1 YbjC family protein [Xenorhabdus bovienii]MDE1491409.1 YbjC family protein [Xenorhabdus bovienii]MDE1495688.1 YbjC family protein [Xenorhabdus bovienii]MDE9444182.1 YbjC family protein [Xenorhabdus bovienii]